MLVEAALLPKTKLVKWRKSDAQFYTVSVRTFQIPFYYSFGSGYCSAKEKSSGSCSGSTILGIVE